MRLRRNLLRQSEQFSNAPWGNEGPTGSTLPDISRMTYQNVQELHDAEYVEITALGDMKRQYVKKFGGREYHDHPLPSRSCDYCGSGVDSTRSNCINCGAPLPDPATVRARKMRGADRANPRLIVTEKR